MAADPLTEPFADLCRALRGVRAQVEALAPVHASLAAFNSAFGDFQSAMALHASCLQFPAPPPAKKVSLQLSGIPAPQAAGASALLQRRSSRESAGSNGGGGAGLGHSSAMKSGAGGRKSAGGGRSTPTGAGSAFAGPAASSGFYHPQPQQAKSRVKVAAGGPQAKKPQAAKRRTPAASAAAKKPESPAWKWDKHIRDQIPRKYQSHAELKKLEIILLYIKNRQSGITIADLVKHSGLPVIKSKEILQTLMKLELIHREHEKAGFVYTFGSGH